MVCFYNTSKKELFISPVKLSKKEIQLLELLLNNQIITFYELSQYYNTVGNARTVKNRLVKKTNLNITTIPKMGYRLDSKIYIL